MKKKTLLPLLIATSIAMPTSLLTVVSCAQKETKSIGITGHYSDKVHFQSLQYEIGKDFSTTFVVDDGYDIENCIWYINDKPQADGVIFSYQLRTISCKASLLNSSSNVTIKVLVQKEYPLPEGEYRLKYLGAEGLNCPTKIINRTNTMIDFSAVGNKNIYSINKITIGGEVVDLSYFEFGYSYHYDRSLYSLLIGDPKIITGDVFIEFSTKEGIFYDLDGDIQGILRGQYSGRAEKGKQLELDYWIPQNLSEGEKITFHKICSNGKELVKGTDYDYEMDETKTSLHIIVKANATINDLIIYLDSTN